MRPQKRGGVNLTLALTYPRPALSEVVKVARKSPGVHKARFADRSITRKSAEFWSDPVDEREIESNSSQPLSATVPATAVAGTSGLLKL